jgi:hypothetical protein
MSGCTRKIKIKASFPKASQPSETSGMSGTYDVVTDISYNTTYHSLRMKLQSFTFRKGLLKDVDGSDNWITVFTAMSHAASC